MARIPKGSLVTLKQRPFVCLACGGKLFRDKDMTVATNFWSPATGLECLDCSYLHTFFSAGQIEMYRPDFGYPT
jgi:hypothetical protein